MNVKQELSGKYLDTVYIELVTKVCSSCGFAGDFQNKTRTYNGL